MGRRLSRSRDNTMIAGVCAGLAKYLDLDPTVMRLVFVLLALAGGHGVLIYFILWIVMPHEQPASSVTPADHASP